MVKIRRKAQWIQTVLPVSAYVYANGSASDALGVGPTSAKFSLVGHLCMRAQSAKTTSQENQLNACGGNQP